MKIRELIAELQKYDSNLEVVVFDDHDGFSPDTSPVRSVHIETIDEWGNVASNGKEVVYLGVY